MPDYAIWLTLGVFAVTVVLMTVRPGGMNEAIPTALGGAVLLAAGIVPLAKLADVFEVAGGAAFTILSAVLMAIVLDGIGGFRWVAGNLAYRAQGSGYRLYWLVVLFCFAMTLFFNNDGSILVTTPVIIRLCGMLELDMRQKIPYLLSGALVATASSAPIGVGSLTNVMSLHYAGLDLDRYTAYMLVPSVLAIAAIAGTLLVCFRHDIPRSVATFPGGPPTAEKVPYGYHSRMLVDRLADSRETPTRTPLHAHPLPSGNHSFVDWRRFRYCIATVVLFRAGLFLAEDVGIAAELLALCGVLALLAARFYRIGTGIGDVFARMSWHVLLLAFGIAIIVEAFRDAGAVAMLADRLAPYANAGDGQAVAAAGLTLAALSSAFHQLPSVLIGAMSMAEMGLDPQTMQLAYFAGMIGSGIGSLLTPAGTLAMLLWMSLLRKHQIAFTWKAYIKTSIVVIPVGLLVGLCSLYGWAKLIA